MNPEENINKKVVLVERNPAPNGIPLVSAIAVAKRAPNDLVELAMEIQKADQFVNATACSKLQIIAEQVRFLQNQAQKVLIDAKVNSDLHHAACNFKKIPGNTYYLYKKASGQTYFSMLSHQEWTNHTDEFIGGFRLEFDHSWTPESDILKKDSQNCLLNKIMATNGQASLTHALQDVPMDM
ncbi:uncharacterized protein CBL_06522 [Carabus blaptoides fortunei]